MSSSGNPASSASALQTARAKASLDLRALTPARVALDTTGVSITTRHALEFSLAHAQARDAVQSTLAVASLMDSLRVRQLTVLSVHSAASTRTEYLVRPDLGRRLSDASAALLTAAPKDHSIRSEGMSGDSSDALDTLSTLSLILADGLSALAIERHALPLLDALLPLLTTGDLIKTWQLAPVVIAEQARVALGDEIGVLLHADVTVMLIGERPGLSSPDSLGAYITWAPRAGRTDAERNCVSNIRTEGLDYGAAAAKIAWCIHEGRRLGLTGVKLRDSGAPLLP